MTKRIKYPIVLIEWDDACTNDITIDEKELKKEHFEPVHCKTVGFLINEGEDTITVAMTHHPLNESLATLWTVPRSWIKKIIRK